MPAVIRSRLTFANVCSFLALLLALSTSGAYAANTVFSTDIVDGEVKTPDIAANAIGTGKIGNGQVRPEDINADAVDGSKILDASVSSADLGFESVNSGEIASDAVNGSEVAANAIDGDEILDGAVTASDLANNSVNTSELATGAVTSGKIGTGQVGAANVANGSLTALEFAGGRSNGAITLNAGFVANGRCRDVGISVPGAEPGDAVLFSVNSSIPQGIVLTGVRVSSDDVIVGKACNLTGGAFPQLDNIQVAIVTFAI